MKMLLSVFRSCRSVRTVLKNFRLNSYLSSAEGVTTKKRNVVLSKIPKEFMDETAEQIESLKIVPEGYKLIYYSRELKIVALARVSMIIFFVAGTWIAVQNYLKPGSFVIKDDMFRARDIVIYLYIMSVIAYVFATKHVYYIFRNENSYKTVCFGVFGKMQQRIIDHQAKELVQSNPKSFPMSLFYLLKGKPVIVSPSGFVSSAEQEMLITPYQPKK